MMTVADAANLYEQRLAKAEERYFALICQDDPDQAAISLAAQEVERMSREARRLRRKEAHRD